MNKNVVIILLIFLVPLGLYWGLTKSKSVGVLPGIASSGAEIIKFSSPMCYECQELEKIFDEVYPAYSSKINLRKIDVTQKSSENQKLIKQYSVKLVPTCIFKDSNGTIIRRTEGSMQPKILENYMKEQINE